MAHLWQQAYCPDLFLSNFCANGSQFNVTNNDMRKSIRLAAELLHYPSLKGIPIDRIDTHSLRSGGANTLSLSGYTDQEIQKMGQWRSAMFKEYIQEELSCFSNGISTKMKTKFNFVDISGGVFHDSTPFIINQPYTTTLATSA